MEFFQKPGSPVGYIFKGMSGRGKGWGIAGLICSLAVALAAAAPAQGLDWSVRQLPGEAGEVMMYGMSCPSPSLCIAVGGNNTLAASANPTGDATAWSVSYLGEGALATGPKAIFPGRQIRGVSCPTVSLCVAVTYEGLVYSSTNPTGGASAWNTANLSSSGPNIHIYGISCPTPSFCVAVAGRGKILTSTNPTGDATAWAVLQLPQPLELRGVSCTSPSLCVAVGDDGDANVSGGEAGSNGMVVTSTDPLGGAWQPAQIPGAGPLFGVSCPSPALCVSGDENGNLIVSSSPTGGSPAWAAADGGGSVQITAASCISTTQCVQVDNNSDVLSSENPTGGASAWTFSNLIPYSTDPRTANANAMWGISCPSTDLCAISAASGKIITVGDPLTPQPAAVKKTGKKKKKKKLHGPKRPRARFGRSPGAALRTSAGRARALYRFFANGHVRGFECKLDGRKFRKCGSPKAFQFGPGKHVVRVRAVGLTGFRGPIATTRVTVFTPAQWPPGTPAPNGKHVTCSGTGTDVETCSAS